MWVFDKTRMKYDFDRMNVNRDALEELCTGNIVSLVSAFDWSETPPSPSFWLDTCCGYLPLDIDLLQDMLKQFDTWEAKPENKE